MKGIILAAGKGTRLRPLTNETPKPLLELGGKPILSYILEGFSSAGVDDMHLVIGYLGKQVKDFYGTSFSDMKITYYEQKEQLGTAHALLLAEEALKNSTFMMSWGDILCEPENYAALRDFHEKGDYRATITLNEVDDPYAGAAVYIENGRVVKIIEKPPKGESTTNWNNRGIFMFDPVIFDEVHALEISPRGEYELPQAIGKMVEKGVPVGGIPVIGFNSDIGTIEEFQEYEEYLRSKQ